MHSMRVLGDQLDQAFQALLATWDRTSDVWNDVVRRKFEAIHLQPLDDQTRQTRQALGRLEQVVASALQQVR